MYALAIVISYQLGIKSSLCKKMAVLGPRSGGDPGNGAS